MKKLFFLFARLCASLLTFAIDSEYCGEVKQSGTNTEAAFTWETNEAGSIVITITETLGGADEATHFRGNALAIGNFKVGEGKADGANYFSHPGTTTGNQLVLTATNAPAPGEKIYYQGVVEYATSKDGNAWPTLTFEYTYGTKCPVEEPVLTRIVLNASATFAKIGEGITLTAQAKDQTNKNMDAVITYEVSPADAGTVADGKYTPSKVGEATITAKSGDVSASVKIYGVPSDNLALNKTCEAGYEPGNQGEISSKANDGNVNTQWVTYADQPASVEWWIVDLGAKYDIAAIDVVWGDPTSTKYILQVRDESPTAEQKADDEAWETVSTQEGITINTEQFIPLVGASGRYVRLHSLTKSSNFFRLKEVRVFGTEWVPTEDNEKPVMTSAELVSKAWNKAVISVAATDNIAIKSFRVVDATNSIDTKIAPTDGKITVSDLTPSTAYNFTITAIDAANNESENSKTVAVTTDAHIFAPAAAATAPAWPAAQVKAIYSPTYSADCNFQEWGSGTTYSQDTYGKKYVLVGGGYFGVDGFSLNCVNMEKLHYDIWIENDATARIVPICRKADDSGNETEYGVTVNLKGQQWNSIDLSLSEGEYAKVTNWTNVYQVKIDNASNLTLWVGNAFFYRTTPLPDTEKPTDFTASLATASYFAVTIAASADDNMGAVNFEVKNGDDVVATGSGAAKATVKITVPNLKPNTEYNFSVVAKDDAGNAADAVAVAAKTLATPAPAPTPDLKGKVVVSAFCDVAATNPAIKIGEWSQTTIAQLVELAEGDHVYFLSNFNYLGWEFTPAIDATGMEYVHVDIFAPEMTRIAFTPISPGKEKSVSQTLKPGEWTSLDVALSEYESAGIVWGNVYQFKFDGADVEFKDLFIDNVYFYKADLGSTLDNVVESGVATKLLRDGQLFIIRDGQTYTIQGAIVR